MIDKYQELRDKGLLAAGHVIITVAGELGSEVVSMQYCQHDPDTGQPIGCITLHMTKIDLEHTIACYKKRHQAGKQLYRAAFGKPPPD